MLTFILTFRHQTRRKRVTPFSSLDDGDVAKEKRRFAFTARIIRSVTAARDVRPSRDAEAGGRTSRRQNVHVRRSRAASPGDRKCSRALHGGDAGRTASEMGGIALERIGDRLPRVDLGRDGSVAS